MAQAHAVLRRVIGVLEVYQVKQKGADGGYDVYAILPASNRYNLGLYAVDGSDRRRTNPGHAPENNKARRCRETIQQQPSRC